MQTRTIMIFPECDHMEDIEKIRKSYDPLYGLVRPHITLVFPFQDAISNEELRRRMEKALKDSKPFQLELQNTAMQKDVYGNFLFLKIKEGEQAIVELHQKLYQSIFKEDVSGQPYVPHMTIGNLGTEEQMQLAYCKIRNMSTVFKSRVDTVAVEMIGEQQESIIIIEAKLTD